MRDFNGKTYWLIGASEGVGRALAHKLSAVGARVVVTARSKDRLEELVRTLPGTARAVAADVTDRAALEAAAEEVGPVDGLVYLSGVLTPMLSKSWDTDAIEQMIDVNLTGAVRAIGTVLPDMVTRDSGHVVLIGSLSAYRGMSGFVGYGATKAGINSLAESMRADLDQTGVTVQVANPGFIRTNMTAGMTGRKPLMISPEQAADRIFDLMQGDSFARNFPLLSGLVVQSLQLMPDWLYFSLFGRKN